MIKQPWYSMYGFSHSMITLAVTAGGYVIYPAIGFLAGLITTAYWIIRELQGPEQVVWYKKLVYYPDRFFDWFSPVIVYTVFSLTIVLKGA